MKDGQTSQAIGRQYWELFAEWSLHGQQSAEASVLPLKASVLPLKAKLT